MTIWNRQTSDEAAQQSFFEALTFHFFSDSAKETLTDQTASVGRMIPIKHY
jgi:hypothetical protein